MTATEPVTLRAGDSIAWSRILLAFPPSDGWSLAYRIIPAAGEPVAIAASGGGDTYSVTLLSDDTANLPAGNALLVGLLTKAGGQQITIYSGALAILPNLALANAFDARSQARRALEDLRAVFAAVSTDANALTSEYQIAGRMRRFRSIEEIILAIRFWEEQVAKEGAAATLIAGGSGRGRIQVRL